ncbi:MAG: preQ(1) synthase [Candidatus Melainabacteria bacterium]|nr:preQ(1) synthase [Candidatus Melainabacteria bacterium]
MTATSSLTDALTSTTETAPFPAIDVWENRHPDRRFLITIDVPEFTSVCPKTGLPDFGTLTIRYIPRETCIELKAFKYYLLAYRNHGIFYENVVNKVMEDIVTACNPHFVEVCGDFSARGGIRTQVRLRHVAPGSEALAQAQSLDHMVLNTLNVT